MNLLGVDIDDLSQADIVTSIINQVVTSERAIFAYVNIYAINLAQSLPWFREFLNSACCAYCDGYGILLGARLAGFQLAHRSTPPDWISSLAIECVSHSITMFLLGGRPGIAERAATSLTQRYPELKINGTHHGYLETVPNGNDNQSLIRTINSSHSDILLVGMGMPLQEKWLSENWPNIDIKVALPVGALLDYLAGDKRRPPHWLAAHGMEWAGRLVFEPRRLWKRYLIGIPYFFLLVIRLRLGLARKAHA